MPSNGRRALIPLVIAVIASLAARDAITAPLSRDFQALLAIQGLPADERVAVKPSFDCTTAHASDEIAICGDPDLARADATMMAGYQNAYAVSGDPDVRESGQAQWLRRRRACGGDRNCLKAAYATRIAAFVGAIRRSK